MNEVWEYNISSRSHEQIYSHAGGFSPVFYSKLNSHKSKESKKWETFLSECLNRDIYYIEEVAYALKEYKNDYLMAAKQFELTSSSTLMPTKL